MTDYSKLVNDLRDTERVCRDRMDGQVMLDAAAAIDALLKENKELIDDYPEMVEADGHWEWRKPNGEVLLPKRGEIVRCRECIHFAQGGWCDREFDWFPVDKNDFCSMAEKMEVQDGQ